MKPTFSQGIPLKKKYGQHFLRNAEFVHHMLDRVTLTPATSVFEIGCGDGFLTRAILQTPVARLWSFEIDPEWASYVRTTVKDARLTVVEQNFLDVDAAMFQEHKSWILLANLPYQITFPILYWLQRHRDLLQEVVIMIQEEVAQKLTKTHGRGYGFPALFFNHYFDIRLLQKVPPTAFTPPPKVFSRLVYLKPKVQVPAIPDEEDFWLFIKVCFKQPRRTLKNNLMQTHIGLNKIPEATLCLRAQQLRFQDFLDLWQLLHKK